MPLLENLEAFKNVSPTLQWVIFIIGCLIAVVALFAAGVSIWLMIKYIRFNRMKNSSGLTGGEIARKILDQNGLQDIPVSTFGSLFFGNSYSHYFHKVRIRRFTKNQKSLTSLAIGAEKATFAVLDKEGDPDMRQRVALTPFIYLGPFAFIPLLVLGILIDIIVFGFTGIATVGSALVGLLLYLFSFLLSVKVLKTEKKAQTRACQALLDQGLATQEEVGLMQELFNLYNLQYIVDIIIAFLEMILKALEITSQLQGDDLISIKD